MRWPILPTLVAALGVPTLIGLGVWQLERREVKQAALAAFERPEVVSVRCDRWSAPEQRAGRSAAGGAGFAHFAECATRGERVRVNLGWSADPVDVAVPAGAVSGALFRLPGGERLLVADDPVQPLQASRAPSAADIPDNHLLYALQWFSFASALAVIYALWIRRWRRDQAAMA